MPRLDVYALDGFTDRVAYAASVIARGGKSTRKFDATAEMYDGEAVTAALVRRAKANPGGKLALNLFKYIGEAAANERYEETKHLSTRGLAEYAAQLRADAEKAYAEQRANWADKPAQAETPAVLAA